MVWLWLVPALLVVLACVPIGVAFEVTSVPRWQSRVRVDWAGLLETNVVLDGDTGRARPADEDEHASSKRRRVPPRVSALVLAIGHSVDLLRTLLAETRVTKLRLNARWGLDDPADTGAFYGALVPLVLALHVRWPRTCTFEPEFTRECLEVSAAGRITLVPLRWLFVMVRFLVSPRTWRIARALGRH